MKLARLNRTKRKNKLHQEGHEVQSQHIESFVLSFKNWVGPSHWLTYEEAAGKARCSFPLTGKDKGRGDA